MTALLFSIGATPYRPAGLAPLYPEARYASGACSGAQRLERRFGRVVIWQRVDADAEVGPGTDVLLTVHLLLPPQRRHAAVEYVLSCEIEVPMLNAARVLDQERARHCVVATA